MFHPLNLYAVIVHRQILLQLLEMPFWKCCFLVAGQSKNIRQFEHGISISMIAHFSHHNFLLNGEPKYGEQRETLQFLQKSQGGN